MDYNEKIRSAKTLDELFELWKEKKPNGSIDHSKGFFIADGIVNEQIWNSGKRKKILFVLKEAYGKDWNNNTLATWLKNDHPTSRIWKRVAKWTYGIQNTTDTYIQPYKNELLPEEHNDALEQIAVMNIKKSNGQSSSDYNDIAKYVSYDKEEIKREFELIDADIIICGYTFRYLYEAIYGKKFDDNNSNENWFYYFDDRLFIDYYHPANHWPDLMNYYGLMGIYQQALINKR